MECAFLEEQKVWYRTTSQTPSESAQTSSVFLPVLNKVELCSAFWVTKHHKHAVVSRGNLVLGLPYVSRVTLGIAGECVLTVTYKSITVHNHSSSWEIDAA